ncbi:MAG: RiPP maturation radical SAM C-methyltransferase [Nitrospira sp.]
MSDDVEGSIDVALVHMPFGSACMPNLGLSILRSILEQQGIKVRLFYFNLEFAALMGPIEYQTIANSYPDSLALAGEWLFSNGLYETDCPGYLNEILAARDGADEFTRTQFEKIRGNLESTKALLPYFLEKCTTELLACSPKIVGFSSTFQQHLASLAVAKRLKQACSPPFIVLGGANCEGPMGLQTLKSHSYLDCIVSGPGEIVFPELVHEILSGQKPVGRVGVYLHGRANLVGTAAEAQLNELPIVDFDDFIESHSKYPSFAEQRLEPTVLMETSRGCWWGQKHHCTFCGLNGSTMAFRQKTPERAIQEIDYYASRYPGLQITAVDNIMPRDYPRTVFAQMRKHIRPEAPEIFYEVKSNFSREELEILSGAGVTQLQPGIESLSTNVLKLMKKGTSGLRNILFLRWCKELGITAYWNVIYGFPGECESDYTGMNEIIPLLEHLTPPNIPSGIRLDRYSPNFDGSPDNGFSNVKPTLAYQYLYPALSENELQQIAYFFDYDSIHTSKSRALALRLTQLIKEWRERHDQSALFCSFRGRESLLIDLRRVSAQRSYLLKGCEHWLLWHCSTIQNVAHCVTAGLAEGWSERDVEAAILSLSRRHLLVREEESILALPLFHRGGFSVPPALALRLSECFGEVNSVDDQPLEGISNGH